MANKRPEPSAAPRSVAGGTFAPAPFPAGFQQTFKHRMEEQVARYLFVRREAGTLHNPMQWNFAVFFYISHGDVEGLEAFLFRERDWVPGPLLEDPLRVAKNNGIAIVGVMAHLVGMADLIDFETCMNVSDACIHIIERAEDERTTQWETSAALIELAAMVHDRQANADHPLVRRAKDYVNQHYHQRISIAAIARDLKVNAEYLSRTFRREEGKPLKQYILDQRIDSMKYLLANSGMSILEISAFLGFSSQSHMTALFRQVTGMTPHQFRLESGRQVQPDPEQE